VRPRVAAAEARAVRFMRRALLLAERGWGQTAPNPMVGAVVVRGARIVGEGWHAVYGGPHAEVMALERAGKLARGATVYVTLEPCSHWGKTPPCVDALIAAGVARVVCATRDPGKKSGGGVAKLRRAGIEVELGLLEEQALEQNAPFFFAAAGAKRPWVTIKLALSADGAVGTRGKRVQLTGPSANHEVHRQRAQSDAIAIGIGTALADDPELTVRLGRSPRIPPIRVVFDRHARLGTKSRLADTAPFIPTVVLATRPDRKRELALFKRGVEVLRTKSLKHALQVLRRHEVRSLLVEGGPTLTRALIRARVVDRMVIFRSPRRLGAGAIAAFDDASFLEKFPVTVRRRFGVDQMTVYDLSR
jgi:diaminohydroxyphosphoribosylaminopyrimidine deaminase/5-amino-6-(5-phosphoribosylamino)uracil reductase